MAKFCIVCGLAAGSGEHVFPAALGGRRTNKNIYCTKHDNSYSSLVGVLARQVDVFNALLGVIPDHSKEAKSVIGRTTSSGEELRLSVKGNSFTTPQVLSREPIENGELINMGFPTYEAMNKWIAEQQAKGFDVTPLEKPRRERYFLGDIQFKQCFGGVCGLGAVAYVTQTFLAQAFPELARSGEVAQFIAYTQAAAALAQIPKGCDDPTTEDQTNEKLDAARQALTAALTPWNGQAPVWWDFDPQPDTTPNAFEFGHRVTVGVDSDDGQIFGRFSLFSSIHFSMCFGVARTRGITKTVTVDINPTATGTPDDIRTVETLSAVARVTRPIKPTEGLSSAISNKSQEKAFTELMRKIEAHSLKNTAKKIHNALAPYFTLSEFEAEELVNCVIDAEAQRVLNMVKFVLQDYKLKTSAVNQPTLAALIDSMIAHDPKSTSGLSPMAAATLALAKGALATQMHIDIKSHLLNERRIAELLGEGPGLAVVGEAVFGPLIASLEGIA